MDKNKNLGPRSFESLGLSADLLGVVKELGYSEMTPIQAQTIPILLKGGDVIGQSKTGSGKTAAFTLPMLEKMNIVQGGKSTRPLEAIIICPTRELCSQVMREVRKLGRKKIGLQVVELAGGVPLRPQAKALQQGVHIAVGTPGRILDHLSRQTLDLSQVKTVVLDEADRMLDMGFQEDMESILKLVPEDRQTILFSATFPPGILKISSRFQHEAVMIKIESNATASNAGIDEACDPSESGATGELTIEQIFYEVDTEQQKPEALIQVLMKETPESALVFCNLKVTTFEVVRALSQQGVSCAVLNGDLEQRERDLVMAKFRNQSIRILVATDVAARGIDVAGLDLVVNYDLPQKPDIYTHRIGRTGRAGKTGKAVALILARERYKDSVTAAITQGGKLIQWQKSPFEKVNLESKMATILLFEGRKNKMRPGDILGALTGDAGLKGEDIGKIEIHDFFAYVAVSRGIAKVALEKLQNGKIKGRKVRAEWPK